MAIEVKFKYPQPFTWAQVMDLDIGSISQGTQLAMLTEVRNKSIVQEITRLQHSLDHLKSTQDQLQYLIDTTANSAPDPEFMGAIQENMDVMCDSGLRLGLRLLMTLPSNSQEERISILKHALARKGVVSPSHYDFNPNQSAQPPSTIADPEPDPPSTAVYDNGLYL